MVQGRKFRKNEKTTCGFSQDCEHSTDNSARRKISLLDLPRIENSRGTHLAALA